MILRRFLSTSSSCQALGYHLPPTIRQLLASQNVKLTEAQALDSTPTTVSGWIKSIRKQKNISFAVVTDGSSETGLQAVLLNKKGENGDEIARKLTNGAAVRLTGNLVSSPGAGQSHELLVDESHDGVITVLGECDPEMYPIQKKSLSNEYLRDNAHLRTRTSQIAAMVRLRDTLTRRIGSWFQDQGFCYAHTPVLTGNDAEGAGEAFRIAPLDTAHPAAAESSSLLPTPGPTEFFSRPAFLTVSHQLHLEALATAMSRVYTLSPCFRAEPSLTGRHLAEFWMLEAEWAFLNSTSGGTEDTCNFVEACLRGAVGELLNNGSPDVEVLWKGGDEKKRKSLEDSFRKSGWWTRMTYTEAVRELESSSSRSVSFEYEPKWGRALQSEHERWLAEVLVGGPVFITDYPAALKPFYMRANPDEKTVACFDLLVPFVGELVGGSVREERVDVLRRNMQDAGLLVEGAVVNENAYKWYEELRRYGGAPHAGFGMGFERLIGWVGGVDNVRECIPMPRWAGRMLL